MANSNTFDIDGVGPVLFERSKRAKHLNISVKPFTGVRVAVPDGLSFRKAREFVQAKTDWMQRHLYRMKQYEKENAVTPDAPADIQRAKAKRELTRRLKHLAEKHGFTYNKVSFRNQKTRWGSCSRKNNISLNMKIICLPEELMDYIILHELLHTRVKNHSTDFWTELNRLVADGKGMASKLRKYRAALL
ncbi:M48 family metallopeptidase [Chloroflexota bacterium]